MGPAHADSTLTSPNMGMSNNDLAFMNTYLGS
jgi:hypothetical protein